MVFALGRAMLLTATWLPTFVALFLNQQVPAAQCLTQYGQTACGYGCVAAYGQVRCAPEPGGACLAAYGRVECSRASYPAPSGAQAECISAYGQVACGYGCVAAYGVARCSVVPGGVCQARYGSVQCVEPPPPAYGWGVNRVPHQRHRRWRR